MRTYIVKMLNSKSSIVGTLTVNGYSAIDAGAAARERLSQYGYDIIKSIECIA